MILRLCPCIDLADIYDKVHLVNLQTQVHIHNQRQNWLLLFLWCHLMDKAHKYQAGCPSIQVDMEHISPRLNPKQTRWYNSAMGFRSNLRNKRQERPVYR
eukprot:Lithocolla_globosa_v1_NODE_3084_length_1770_cov_2.865889.p2 type:complete len:100 gc:universal NODE_3084_length_1770_cov_2.865889:739-1038(+)